MIIEANVNGVDDTRNQSEKSQQDIDDEMDCTATSDQNGNWLKSKYLIPQYNKNYEFNFLKINS